MYKKGIYITLGAILLTILLSANTATVKATTPWSKGLTNMWCEERHETVICCEKNQNNVDCTLTVVDCSLLY